MRKNMKKSLLFGSICALSLGCSSSVYAGRVYNAAKAGNLVALRRFIYTEGESVNDRDSDDETALMGAAYDGNFKVVEFLVDNGADINAKKKYGATALIWATEFSDSLETVKFLVDNGADVNKEDEFGKTALIAAAGRGNFKIVKFLVDNGADVNARDKDGDTALMAAAARKGNFEVVKFLVDNGAHVNAKDEYGGTALTLALENGYTDVVKYLKKHGAF